MVESSDRISSSNKQLEQQPDEEGKEMGHEVPTMAAYEDNERQSEKNSWFDEYDARANRLTRLKWLSIALLIGGSFAISSLIVFTDIDESTIVFWKMIYVIIGMMILTWIFIHPLLKPQPGPPTSEGLELVSRPADLNRPWEETLISRRIYWVGFLIPVIILLILTIFIPTSWLIATSAGAVALILIFYYLFGNLKVRCTPLILSFHYGPFGHDLEIENIESIRCIPIRFGKEYLAPGIEIAPDGSKAYIASGTTGVRIQTKEGQQFLITVSDPQSLVEYVKTAQKDGFR